MNCKNSLYHATRVENVLRFFQVTPTHTLEDYHADHSKLANDKVYGAVLTPTYKKRVRTVALAAAAGALVSQVVAWACKRRRLRKSSSAVPCPPAMPTPGMY